MNFTKLLTSCKEKRQHMSNQAFTTTKKGSHIKWQNLIETIAELVHAPSTSEHKDANENQWEEKAGLGEMQMKTNEKEKQHHLKWTP